MSAPTRLIDDTERRARMARRHALAAEHRVADAAAVVDAVVALHATEPATPYLSVQARTDGFVRADLDLLLYESRSHAKQLAMRRTVFVFPRDVLGAVLGAPSARVARTEHARLVKEIGQGGIADEPEAWLQTARCAVLAKLAGGHELSARDLREQVPELAAQVTKFEGKKYGGTSHLAPSVLIWLGAQGDVVRGSNASHWRTSRNHWARADEWFGGSVSRSTVEEGYAELVARYLHAFGPVTETDIVWWFGATKTAVRAALAQVQAVQVRLEHDRIGWVLPGDDAPVDSVEPWAALLPALDPTPMGFKQREFYLDDEMAAAVYDSAGNCGATAWWDGRIVGAYVQDDEGAVELVLRSGTSREARSALEIEAERLGEWLAGERVNSVYKAPITLR